MIRLINVTEVKNIELGVVAEPVLPGLVKSRNDHELWPA